MSAFKDMVAKDRDIFLNLDELGEEHDVSDKTIICVFDDKTLRERQGGAELAVAESSILLYAKCEDLPSRKGFGAELMVDGRPYMVNTWDEDMGMATVTLSTTINV